jgi:proteic killer suppression protein
MIRSFKDKGLKRLFEDGDRSRMPPDMIDRIEEILQVLDASAGPDGMNRPSFRLHPLKGGRKGQWAVTVRANWRIVFSFTGGNAVDVDFVDYHSPGRQWAEP